MSNSSLGNPLKKKEVAIFFKEDSGHISICGKNPLQELLSVPLLDLHYMGINVFKRSIDSK
jgi:hypothetical protein